MENLHRLKDMLCREMDEIVMKGDLNAGDLETVHKLTDTIKNIYKIEMLKGSGYSGMYEGGSYGMRYDGRGGSYGSYDGYSGRRGRDSMGRYSSAGGKSIDDLIHSEEISQDEKWS